MRQNEKQKDAFLLEVILSRIILPTSLPYTNRVCEIKYSKDIPK